MCIICLELIKLKMTIKEARKANDEILWDKNLKDAEKISHAVQLQNAIDLDELGEFLDYSSSDR